MSNSQADPPTAIASRRALGPVGLFVLALVLLLALPRVLEALLLEFDRYRGEPPGLLTRTSSITALVYAITALALWQAGALRSRAARWTHRIPKRVTAGAALVVCGSLALLARAHLPGELAAPLASLTPIHTQMPPISSATGYLVGTVVLLVGITLGECVFRGWLLDLLRVRVGDDTAVAAQAVVYAGLVWPLGMWELGLVVGVVTGLLRVHTGSLLPGTLALAAYALWQVVRVLAMDFAVRTANLGLLQIVAPHLPVLLTGAVLAVGVGLYWMRPAWRETGRGVRWLFAGLGLALLLRAAVIAFQTA